MALINKYPYTDFNNLNLDWIIEKVKEYIFKYEKLEDFVNETVDEQNRIIAQAVEDLAHGMQDLREYITENLETIANEIINELIESGELNVGTEYDAETEELNIVLTQEG